MKKISYKAAILIDKYVREKKPFKAKVTPDTAEKLQELLFSKGVYWKYSGTTIKHLNEPYYFTELVEDRYLLDAYGFKEQFGRNKVTEVNLTEEYNLPRKTVKEIVHCLENKVPFKIKVNPEESAVVQQICFDMGVGWISGQRQIKETDKGNLLINAFGIAYIRSNFGAFIDKEIIIDKEPTEVEKAVGIRLKEKEVKVYKTNEECLRALLEGKVLEFGDGNIYKLVDGTIKGKYKGGNEWEKTSLYVTLFVNMTEYQEPQWYDNLSEDKPVLCWVESASGDKYLDVISKYDSVGRYFTGLETARWPKATPLTDDEIKKFLKDA